MPGTDLSAGIESLYQAGSSSLDWESTGRELFRLLGADAGTLRIRRPDGSSVNLLLPQPALDAIYLQKYIWLDPLRGAAERIRPDDGWLSAVNRTEDLVSRDALQRSEFYQHYAEPNGQVHMLVGSLGDPDCTIIAFFRETSSFSDEARSHLAFLLPHVRRALELYNRLTQAQLVARIGEGALEAMAGSVVVVDAAMNILLANASAEEMLRDRRSPMVATWHPTSRGAQARLLSVRDRGRAARLQALVADAAGGGTGGAMRMDIDDNGMPRQLAVIVTPQPVSPRPAGPVESRSSPVLVVVKELSRAAAPRPSLLSDLFGLSIAESAVGVALLGGQTAETVARERDVSLETVRSQIRTVLRKSEAANLRDFERIGALLATVGQAR